MSPVAITLLVIVIVLAIIIAVLYFLGKKAQKKQAEQQELLDANKQTVSMLIIDKKRMKMKDAGLPQMVIDQTPKMMRGSKLPIIKAKVGPQIVSLICARGIRKSCKLLERKRCTVKKAGPGCFKKGRGGVYSGKQHLRTGNHGRRFCALYAAGVYVS